MADSSLELEKRQRILQWILAQTSRPGELPELATAQAAFPGHEDRVASLWQELMRTRVADDEAPPVGYGLLSHGWIGRYRIERELGRGGQGRVFLAEDERLGRRVAVKVLHALFSEEARRRFEREAEITSRLEHPGICAVYDIGEDHGLPFLAMRYVEGATLAATAERTREDFSTVPWENVVRLIEQAARALHAAHEAGVVHRDVKPGNLMVTPNGDCVVMDFGLARAEQLDAARITRPGDVFGTPEYMSPEQLDGAGSVDRRSDVWSLGVTLYECVTGHRPFAGATAQVLAQAVLREDPFDARQHRSALPRDLGVVLDTALEKNPSKRYQTAARFAEDLQRVLCSEPVSVRAISSWTRAVRWAGRNRLVAGLVASILGTLLIGLAVATFLLVMTMRAEANARGIAAVTVGFAQERFGNARTELLDRGDLSVARIEEIIRPIADLLGRLVPYADANDPKMLATLTLGHHVLALAQGGTETRNLGRPDLARRNLHAAIGFARQLLRVENSAVHQVALARIQMTLAQLFALEGERGSALDLAGKASALLDPLLGSASHREALMIVATIESLRGDLAGSSAAARSAYQRGLDHGRELVSSSSSPTLEERRQVLRFESRIANGEADLNRALELQRDVLRRFVALLAEEPEHYRLGEDVAISWRKVGGLQQALGHRTEAAESHRNSLGGFSALLAKDPNDDRNRFQLASAHANCARALRLIGEAEKGLVHSKASRELYLDLARRHPDRPRERSALVESQADFGDVLREFGSPVRDLRKAIECFAVAEGLLQELIGDELASAWDRVKLGYVWTALGELHLELEEFDAAEKNLERAYAFLAQLADEESRQERENVVSTCLDSLASLYIARGQHDRALETVRRVLKRAKADAERSQTWPDRRNLAMAHARVSEALSVWLTDVGSAKSTEVRAEVRSGYEACLQILLEMKENGALPQLDEAKIVTLRRRLEKLD